MGKKSDIVIEAENIIYGRQKNLDESDAGLSKISRNALNPTSKLKPVSRKYHDDEAHKWGDASGQSG